MTQSAHAIQYYDLKISGQGGWYGDTEITATFSDSGLYYVNSWSMGGNEATITVPSDIVYTSPWGGLNRIIFPSVKGFLRGLALLTT